MVRVVAALLVAGCGRLEFSELRLDDATVQIDSESCAVTNGLVAHWSIDAGDVGQIADRSGRGYHGILNGTPVPVVADGALDFTATTNAWVEIAALPLATAPGAFNSVSLWFWNADADVDDAILYLPHAGGAQPPRYDLWLNSTRIGVTSLCINTGSSDCWGISDPELLGRWVHVVAVFANGRIDGGSLYIDGVAANTSCRFGVCDEMRSAMAPFTLGGPDTTYSWTGKLDDVRVYDRALAGEEAAQLYACAR